MLDKGPDRTETQRVGHAPCLDLLYILRLLPRSFRHPGSLQNASGYVDMFSFIHFQVSSCRRRLGLRTPPLSRHRASSWDNKGHDRRGQSWLDKSFWVELASRRPWKGTWRGGSRDLGDGSVGGRPGRRAWGGGRRGNVQVGEDSPLLGAGQFQV